MLDLSSEINLSYALCSQPTLTILNFGIFQNLGMNYKASTTHKLKPSPIGSETQNPKPSQNPYFNRCMLSLSFHYHKAIGLLKFM